MPRVLVIDDSRATRMHLSQALEQRGWEVVSEGDAEQGAATALSSPPDVVISDLWMPGLSGLQLCRLLHSDERTASIPIVLVSARLDRRAKFWAKQSGATLSVSKDQLANLPEVLSSLLATRDTQQARPVLSQVTAASIPSRLSHLLDQALFESVVAKEVRSLAFAPDLNSLFQGLIEFLGQLMPYRWLALSIGEGQSQVACVHVHPEEEKESVAQASEVLKTTERTDMRVTRDDRGELELSSARGSRSGVRAPGEVLSFALELASMGVGHVAMACYPGALSAADKSAFTLIGTEIGPALRSVALAEETRRLAATDGLTGLWNRRQGTEVLEQSVAGSKRYELPLSIAMIDVDHFKKVNDTYGHRSGDLALKHVSAILKRTTRTADAVIRWGGEEFFVIIPSTGALGARVAGERMRHAVAQTPAIIEKQQELPLSVSIGVATYEGEETLDELVGRADKALYLAKSRGRNRVEVG